jgi:hypothetical protein
MEAGSLSKDKLVILLKMSFEPRWVGTFQNIIRIPNDQNENFYAKLVTRTIELKDQATSSFNMLEIFLNFGTNGIFRRYFDALG